MIEVRSKLLKVNISGNRFSHKKGIRHSQKGVNLFVYEIIAKAAVAVAAYVGRDRLIFKIRSRFLGKRECLLWIEELMG